MRTFRADRSFSTRLLALACALALAAAQALPAAAQVRSITVQVDRPGAAIPRTLFGLFFEDINFGADGGLYPERVKNRSFEFPEPLMSWKKSASPDAQGEYAIRTDRPASPTNPHYLRLTSRAGRYGVTNDGFRGVSVE